MRYHEYYLNEDENIDYNKYNLQQKYDYYNRTLFNGELPKIPLMFAKLKTLGGVVKYRVQKTRNVSPLMVRLGANPNAGATLIPGTMKLQISNLYLKTEQHIDAILIHEMIHVYFAANGDVDTQHGPKFITLARQLSSKVGFEIPLTDKIENPVLSDTAIKPVGVILMIKNDDSYIYGVFTKDLVQRELQLIKDRLQLQINVNPIKKGYVGIIATKEWTFASTIVPVQRKYGYTPHLYKLKDTMYAENFLNHAKILATIEKQPRT